MNSRTAQLAGRAAANKLRSALTMLGILIGVAVGDHPARGRHRLLAGGAGADQRARHEHDHGASARGRFGSGAADDRHPVTDKRASPSRSVSALEDQTQAPDVDSRLAGDRRASETAAYGDASYAHARSSARPRLPGRRGLHARRRQPDHDSRRDQPQTGRPHRPDGRSATSSRAARTRSARRSSSARPASRSSGVLAEKGSSGTPTRTRRDRPVHGRPGRADRRVGAFSELLVAGQVDERAQRRAAEVESILASQAGTTVADLPLQHRQPGHAALDGRVDLEHVHDAARRGRRDLAARRRHRRHEHHARHRHRAHPRDRDPQGGRRAAARRSSASSSARRSCSR